MTDIMSYTFNSHANNNSHASASAQYSNEGYWWGI